MTVLVLLTDNTEGRAALQRALHNRDGDELHLVPAGGDTPSRPEPAPSVVRAAPARARDLRRCTRTAPPSMRCTRTFSTGSCRWRPSCSMLPPRPARSDPTWRRTRSCAASGTCASAPTMTPATTPAGWPRF